MLDFVFKFQFFHVFQAAKKITTPIDIQKVNLVWSYSLKNCLLLIFNGYLRKKRTKLHKLLKKRKKYLCRPQLENIELCFGLQTAENFA